MEPTLDQVRQELAEIYEELLELPADDFARRAELRSRQHELRQVSARLVEGEPLHDADTLRQAYNRLHRVRDHLLDQRLVSTSTSVGDAGIESEFTEAVNRAIDAGVGIDEIEDRLNEIIRQLRTSG